MRSVSKKYFGFEVAANRRQVHNQREGTEKGGTLS